MPLEWAINQHYLGQAYADLTLGDWQQNMHKALTCYELALAVFQRLHMSTHIQDTQHDIDRTRQLLSHDLA